MLHHRRHFLTVTVHAARPTSRSIISVPRLLDVLERTVTAFDTCGQQVRVARYNPRATHYADSWVIFGGLFSDDKKKSE
jgi:hypothetical protein